MHLMQQGGALERCEFKFIEYFGYKICLHMDGLDRTSPLTLQPNSSAQHASTQETLQTEDQGPRREGTQRIECREQPHHPNPEQKPTSPQRYLPCRLAAAKPSPCLIIQNLSISSGLRPGIRPAIRSHLQKSPTSD